MLVKSYVRRYLKALYREIGDWIEENQARAAKLLKYSICYVEEFMTQYCDHLLVAMYKAILNQDNKVVKSHIPYCFRLVGRYVSPKSYGPLVIDAIENKIASFYAYTAPGSLRAFGHLFSGSIELLQPGQDLDFIHPLFKSFIDAVDSSVIESIDIETAHHLVETLDTMIRALVKKQSEGVNVEMCRSYLPRILNYLIRCLSAYSTYKLQKKVEPEDIKEQRERCHGVIEELTNLAVDPKSEPKNEEGGKSFFDSQIVGLIDETYVDLVEKYKKWAAEEQQRNVEREEEKQKWLEIETARQGKAAEARRTKNREEIKKEKENNEKQEAKLVAEAKQIEAVHAELRAQGESEESIQAIMDAKAADEKLQEQEAAKKRIMALEEAFKKDAQDDADAAKAEQEAQANAEKVA